MSRLISLIVLLASIVIIGALFYKVMIGFLVPVFLAAVLVVVFRPLHRWVFERVGKQEHIAAGITTALVIFSVLLPAGLIITMAAVQGTGLVSSISTPAISIGLNNARKKLGLQSPCQDNIRSIQASVEEIQKEVGASTLEELSSPNGKLDALSKKIHQDIDEILPNLRKFLDKEVERNAALLEQEKDSTKSPPANADSDGSASKTDASKSIDTASDEEKKNDPDTASLDHAEGSVGELQAKADAEYKASKDAWSKPIAKFHDSVDLIREAANLLPLRQRSQNLVDAAAVPPPADLIELQTMVVQLGADWQETKLALLGGQRVMANLREFANPSPKQIRDATTSVIGYLQPKLISLTGATAEFLVRLIIGTAIMIVSLYFFLYDGPRMVQSLMKLSPLDDRYEMELLTEFDRISRAIVLAMVFSAIIQGLTAGLGYYMASMPSLLFLTILSILCGLIPFVGPSVVWIPVCIYLAVFQERYLAAGLLALWGMIAVASIDNVVKAYVLHGQSQLHPLLALLSILGGVQALGPIGLVVGPISVVMLQTLLSILQRELSHIDHSSGSHHHSHSSPSKSTSNWMSKLKRRPSTPSTSPLPPAPSEPAVTPPTVP